MAKNTNDFSTNSLALEIDNTKSKNSEKLTPAIAKIYSNKGSCLIALNNVKNNVGKKQDFISFSKEWKYSLYFYNNSISKNLSSDSVNFHKLITKYFYVYLNHLVSSDKYRSFRVIRRSLNKIHVARSEIKYTNSKIIFTIYTYNREKLALLRNKQGKKILGLIKKLARIINTKFQNFNALAHNNNLKLNTTGLLKFIFKNQILLIMRYKFRLNFNKYKFETRFLIKLAKFIKKFPLYNRTIVFNIVNLKSISSHTDLFTRLAILKSKKRYAKLYRIIFYILNTGKVPKLNKISEKSRRKISVNLNLIENKFFHFNLSSLLAKKDDLENHFLHIRNNLCSLKELGKVIFNSINYKNLGGIKLSIKGRLTKRYRADRAIHRLQWKGGLRNLDSSYKGIPVARKRGFMNLGVEYSIFSSKRRIGAFAVKGWTNGK